MSAWCSAAPIGQNQGVQFPIARAYAELEAADMMCRRAAALFDAARPCGADANIAKLLASEAAWKAAEAAMQTHGGFAYAREYDIERKWREVRLYQIAPISTNLILAYVGAARARSSTFLLRRRPCWISPVKLPTSLRVSSRPTCPTDAGRPRGPASSIASAS